MNGTMTFRTEAQAAIFALELLGQFSDGYWENSTQGDWETWCNAEITFGNDVGRDFHTSYDKYNLSAPRLLDAVSMRMIGYARLARRFGYDLACELHCRIGCDGTFAIPAAYVGEYYDKERARVNEVLALAKITVADVESALADDWYGIKNLKLDLREMKIAMKTRKT